LTRQFFTGGSALFGGRRVLLHDLRNLLDTHADLGNAGGLFVGRGGNVANQTGNLTDTSDDFIQCAGGFVGNPGTFLDVSDRTFD